VGKAFSIVKETLRSFWKERPMQLAAALSYYTLLSLAPLVLVTVAIAGLVFGREAVQGRLVEEMRGLVGEAGAEVIQMVLQSAAESGANKLSLGIGLFTLLLGATTVFVQLQVAFNQMWNVEAAPAHGGGALLNFIKKRLLSLAMVLGVGFLLLVSLVVSAALSALGAWAGSGLDALPIVLQIGNALVSLAVVTLLFGMMFKYLPDVELAWRDVWFGALVTAALFTAGKYLIGLYLGRASIGSAYGAAGSVVVLLVWVYYASLIVFFGAEMTQVHARRRRPVRVEDHGVALPAAG
jgi:membrane protein